MNRCIEKRKGESYDSPFHNLTQIYEKTNEIKKPLSQGFLHYQCTILAFFIY